MNRQRVLRLIADVCLKKGGRERLGDLDALMDAYGIDGPDRETLIAEGSRLGVYRTLVRNNVATTVFRILPLTRRWVNAHADDAFDDAFVDFMDAHGPTSPLLRDIPRELVSYVTKRWPSDPRLPAWALELAIYELALFEADAAPDDEQENKPERDLSLDARVTKASGTSVHRFEWNVIALADVDDDVPATPTPPSQQETLVVVSRDREGEVFTTPVDGLVFAVLTKLFDGSTLGEAVTAAAASTGAPLSPETLSTVAGSLATLAARGALS